MDSESTGQYYITSEGSRRKMRNGSDHLFLRFFLDFRACSAREWNTSVRENKGREGGREGEREGRGGEGRGGRGGEGGREGGREAGSPRNTETGSVPSLFTRGPVISWFLTTGRNAIRKSCEYGGSIVDSTCNTIIEATAGFSVV